MWSKISQRCGTYNSTIVELETCTTLYDKHISQIQYGSNTTAGVLQSLSMLDILYARYILEGHGTLTA